MADDLGTVPMQGGDRVWVQAPGRTVVGTVEKSGPVTAAVSVDGNGTWLVAKEVLCGTRESGR